MLREVETVVSIDDMAIALASTNKIIQAFDSVVHHSHLIMMTIPFMNKLTSSELFGRFQGFLALLLLQSSV